MNQSEEFAVKLDRVQTFLDAHELGGVVLSRGDNFAWLGCGADNLVNNAAETGVASLVVRPDVVTLVTNNIEMERLLTEELPDVDIGNTEEYPWHEPDRHAEIVRRLGTGARMAADDGTAGLPPLPDGFQRLRYMLTAAEVDRYQELGADATLAMESAARSVERGMTEREAAALIGEELRVRGITPIVLLVAADERIRRWRHPLVKHEPIEQYVMLVFCGRRQGLIAAMTRLVHFGQPDEELMRRHRAVCAVDAAAILGTRPGRKVAEVFEGIQDAYAENGFPEEWKLHHQGGGVGYLGREFIATPDCKETVRAGQAYAWNPSICGTKCEDTILVREEGVALLTAPSDDWPTIEAEAEGQTIERPDMLVK